jgi:transcriptional regulator NrdR family protein
MPVVKCSHCGHNQVGSDAHGRYKPYDKSFPKRCRGCRYCNEKYGTLPLIDN